MLSGDLAEFPFPSLVGALMSAGRTGRLHLRPPFLEAEVYLRGGLRRAPFVFEPEALPPHTTLLGGLEVPARLAQAQAAWEKVKLPADWGLRLRLPREGSAVELPPEALGLLARVEGKRIAEVLLAPGVLRQARVLSTLLEVGALEAYPEVDLPPEPLVVLPIYGPSSGVAYVDEALYAQWARAIRRGFRVRLLPLGAVLEVRPRPNLQGRVGLMEEDLKRLRLRRGDKVEAVPEV